MYECACIGHVSAVETLHRLGADIDRADDNGRTPAFAAARQGHHRMVKLLVDLGADINHADDGGEYNTRAGMLISLMDTMQGISLWSQCSCAQCKRVDLTTT